MSDQKLRVTFGTCLILEQNIHEKRPPIDHGTDIIQKDQSTYINLIIILHVNQKT